MSEQLPRLALERRHPDLDAAAALLRHAFGPLASTEWALWSEAPTPLTGEQRDVLAVRWAGQARRPAHLRLVPWGGPDVAPTAAYETESSLGSEIPIVWVLPRATSAQRDVLRARGAQFVDLSGAVHLALPWALVDRADLPAVRAATRPPRAADPFADRSSLVLRTLFDAGDFGRTWQVRELAAAASVGVSTTSEVLKTLQERHLVTVARHGRTAQVQLTNPAAALGAWTRAYDFHLNHQLVIHAPIGDPARFLRRLPDLMHPRFRWALTMQAGASLVAPHAAWDRVHVYVDVPAPDRADWRHVLALSASRIGGPAGPDGRLVLVAPYYATSAWHGLRTVRGLPVVSDLQLALDLWHYPLRGREQAEHLVQPLLQPQAAPPREAPTPPRPSWDLASAPARDV